MGTERLAGVSTRTMAHRVTRIIAVLAYVAAGAAGFLAAYLLYGRATPAHPAPEASSNAVQITAAEADALRRAWVQQWNRAPTDAEFRRLLGEHLRDAILAREAQSLGLHDDDAEVRRRLARKMTAAMEASVPAADPTEDDLKRTLDAHRAEFAVVQRVSFTQIFFSRERRGARATADAAAAAARLRGDKPRGRLDAGDPTMLPATLDAVDEAAIAAQFGAPFAQRVLALPTGSWQGPIESSVGVHLVRVTERSESSTRALAEVREEVTALWRDERRKAASDAAYEVVRRKYDVAVDPGLLPFFDAGAVKPLATR